MDCKTRILELIKEHPKHFTRLIKKDEELMQWVNENAVTTSSATFLTTLYSAINSCNTVCESGKQRQVSRMSNGLNYCSHAKSCICLNKTLSTSVSATKSNLSTEQITISNNKRELTMQEKYGCSFNSQRIEVKEILKKPKIPAEVYTKLTNKDWLENEYVTKQKTSVDIARDLGVYYSTVLFYCNMHGFEIRQYSNYSLVEREVAEYIKSFGFDVKLNNRLVLIGKEIDVYVPAVNLGIEINGLYWHSLTKETNTTENKNKHLAKTIIASDANINLLHITDYEWKNKQDIIKSYIKSKLGLNTRVYARQLRVKEITSKESKPFLDKYHLQGNINSKNYIALVNNTGEIITVATFGKCRFISDANELLRFATKSNITVVGGLSKIISYYTKTISSKRLITYCDRSKSSGNGYNKSGFTFVKYSSPGFYWTNGTDVISRHSARGKTLQTLLKNYDSNLSQDENMFNHGYMKYWDCGNSVWELKI
jgi:hypothetical protein